MNKPNTGKSQRRTSDGRRDSKQLREMLEDTEATCDEVIPRSATIIGNRWNKKFVPEKLTLMQDKYERPANCPAAVSVKVNPEIWAKLPT